MKKLVLFDWYKTLADYKPPIEEVYANVYREFGIEVIPEDIEGGLFGAFRFFSEENKSLPIGSRSREEMEEFYLKYHQLVLQGKAEIKREIILPMTKLAWERAGNLSFSLYDDSLPALKEVKDRGLKLGIISNIDRDIDPICEELEVRSYTDFTVTSKEVGHDKPHPAIFLAALSKGEVNASEAIYIGDQYSSDVLGAEGVGINAILLDRKGLFEREKCTRIRSLSEVKNYI